MQYAWKTRWYPGSLVQAGYKLPKSLNKYGTLIEKNRVLVSLAYVKFGNRTFLFIHVKRVLLRDYLRVLLRAYY